jgi:Fe-S cluster assembly protein SufD
MTLHLGKIASTEDHTFAALNTALFEDGVVVHLSKGAEVPEVLEIVHVTEGDAMIVAPRVLIVAEENSRVQIVETYVTNGNATSVTIPVTEVVVHPYANVEHVRVQDEAVTNHHIALWQVHQHRDSEYRSYNVAFGASLGRTDQNIYLDGEHIVTRLDGVVVANGDQLLDNHTKLDHAKPNCNSFEIYKQIVDDRATVVFNGKIFVHQDAQKTDAKQTNQALLLSPTATIDSKPQLEIFADDVKCTHGATVGQLEELPLFYMKQRGVPHEQAQAILVYAFAAEVLELISNDEVKHNLEARLFTKLGIED